MFVTLLGIVMLVSPVHPLNAFSPSDVRELLRVMLVISVHPLNASLPILFPLVIVTDLRPSGT